MRAYTESDVAQMLSSGIRPPFADEYEREQREWIERHLANCPPLSEQQKAIIRTAFAADRAERSTAA